MYDEIRAKTKQETDKKCPACGGTMDFNPKTGSLACPYCGYIQEIPIDDTADKKVEEKDFLSEQTKQNCDWGAEKKTVVCKSCAAVSVYDALQISDVCPYCGSNQVTEEKGADSLAPDGVCPFAITDKEAGSNFHKWLKGKIFCPKLLNKVQNLIHSKACIFHTGHLIPLQQLYTARNMEETE